MRSYTIVMSKSISGRFLHPWDVTPAQAGLLQRQGRRFVVIGAGPIAMEYIAGADVAYTKNGCFACGAVVVLRAETLEVAEKSTACGDVSFPYLPGLLAFRELPLILQAFDDLRRLPDVLLYDGHGIAHPQRFGAACHLGVALDLPTIGVAKSRLVGRFSGLCAQKGSYVPLMEGEEGIGVVLRTRSRVKPVFVSPGHKIDFETARSVVLQAVSKYRLPEPIRQAHLLANARVREET